jgi:hypothetical protein
VCHMRMRKINPFLFSSPCCIGWVGGEWDKLRQVCPRLSSKRYFFTTLKFSHVSIE